MKIISLLLVIGPIFFSASAAEETSPKIPSVLTERDYLELGKYLYKLDKISPEVVIEQIMQRDPNAIISSKKYPNVEFVDASFQGNGENSGGTYFSFSPHLPGPFPIMASCRTSTATGSLSRVS